jgi:hypothetical protein
LAPIRWEPEDPCASLPMRNARVQAMVFPGTGLLRIGLVDSISIPK